MKLILNGREEKGMRIKRKRKERGGEEKFSWEGPSEII